MKIITLCGSIRFKNAFKFLNIYLTMQGYIVLSVAMWSQDDDILPTKEQEDYLNRIHLAKICGLMKYIYLM